MPKITPRVAVLMLGYNDRENLSEALSSVIGQSYTNYDTFFIDNASQDGSIEFVQKNFPAIKIISHTKNIGYAGA